MGYFITLEGTEGAGKTTMAKRLCALLKAKNYDVICTREPGGTPLSEKIRSMVLDRGRDLMEQTTEALLFTAGSRQHVVEVIEPQLARGGMVISDRYFDSALVYQGHARGLGIPQVYEMTKFASGNTMPHLTIFLDLDPEIGLSRVHKDKAREINRFDTETSSFHAKVHEGYKIVRDMFPERFYTVDATREFDELANHLVDYIIQRGIELKWKG